MSIRGGAASVLLIGVIGLSLSAHVFAGECARPAVRYEVLMLGNLGASGGYASDVSELGQVTGASSRSDQVGRAFVWDCLRGMRNIGAVSEDHIASIGLHINNRGEVVGQSVAEEDNTLFIWDRRRGMRSIESGNPYSFNDRGEITFLGYDGMLRWTEASGSVPLETLTGINYREAFVNERREIGGFGAHPISPDDRFLVWSQQRGVETRGPEPTDAYISVLRGFNNRSDLLGISFLFVGAAVPFIVDRSGQFRQLFSPRIGEYYEATSFNTLRQVIGFSFASGDSSSQQPFIWDSRHGVRNLNMLVYGRIPGANEPRVTRANSINEWGWIAGAAIAESGPYDDPALLVPVPANNPRYRNLSRLRGPALCATLAASQLEQVQHCGR